MDNQLQNKFSASDMQQAWKLIESVSHITLLTHVKPDGDGISACAALDFILTRMGKIVETIYPNTPELNYKRQPKKNLLKNHTHIPNLIISCDVANLNRMYFPDLFKSIPLVNIDHHISNSIIGAFNFVVPHASSTCEVVYDMLMIVNPTIIDSYTAECLLMGILYDSQVFHTSNTTAKTLRIAAHLIDLGANMHQLEIELLSNKNPKIIKFWGSLLSNVHFAHNNQVAWIAITQKDLQTTGLTLSSLVGFSNFLWQMSDVDITILFYETEDKKTKISLRSKKSDVNAIAKTLGGGGHKLAAGILLDLTMDQAIDKTIGAIRK